ncbi:MAG: outer membrane protein [Candidatus Berkiella sp.]
MKKVKLALCVTAGLLATSAQAQWQGNWLLGVSAGGAWHDSDDLNVTVAQGGAAPFARTYFTNNDNDDGNFIWGLLAGYQARCNGWLLGAEINVDWRNDGDNDYGFAFTDATVGGVTGFVSHDRDVVVGLTGRLGYEVSPYFMPYIRLGVDHGDRDFDFAITTVAPAAIITAASNNDNNHNWGFVGGVGAEFPLPMVAGLSLRAEWNYHSRGHNDNDIVALASDNVTLFTVSGGDRHEQTARASLVFNFPG